MKLPVPVSFEWNKGNLEKNWKKHKVHFKKAEEIFFNRPLSIYKDIKHSQKENRLVALGVTNKKRKLYSAFTVRNKKIRIISVRDQSKKERELYAKKEIN